MGSFSASGFRAEGSFKGSFKGLGSGLRVHLNGTLV